MHCSRWFIGISLVLAGTSFLAGVVEGADNDPVTVTGILKAAKCPLTEAQQKRMAAYEPPQGNAGVALDSLFAIFTDAQNKALIAKLGETPAVSGQLRIRPRYLLEAILVERDGCPLTEAQVAALKNAGPGSAPMYTPEQREALAKIAPRPLTPLRVTPPGRRYN